MLNSPVESDEDRIAEIVARGPRGALVLAGITTFIVVALWLAFYLMVFMPRGAAQ